MISQSNYVPKRLYFLIFLLLSFGSSAAAQIVLPSDSIDLGLGGNNAIVGSVFDSSGQRMETRVTVRLATMTRGDVVTVANEKGDFSFRGLPPGNYTIIIEKEKDFETFTQQVNIIQFRGSPPQVSTLTIRLVSKAKAQGKPGVIDSELANVPQKAVGFYNKSVELAKEGKYKEAIGQLQLSISEYPDFMLAYNELGVQYLRLNDLTKADEAFQAALKIKPNAFAPLMNRGIVIFTMKRFEEAESILVDALKLKENSPTGHYFLGQTLANLGRFDEAEKELLSAIDLGGGEMKEAHRVLAIIYSSRGNKKRAADELETYLRLFPLTPDAEQLRKTIRKLKGLDDSIPAKQ